jgi:hypothetical protein
MTRSGSLAVAFACVVIGCGGGQSPSPKPDKPSDGGGGNGRRIVEDTSDDDPDDGVEVVSARGRMEPDAINAAVSPRAADLEECYADRVGKRRWLGGKLELKWKITKAAQVTSVVIADSDLGAWPVEKCVLDIARQMTFGPPKGGDADFSVPLEFSAKGASVWWDEDIGVKAVGKRVDDLGKCAKSTAGKVPGGEVLVTIYVGTRGKVQSVGFASPDAIPDEWADCANKTIEGWQLPDPRGKVAKLALRWRS